MEMNGALRQDFYTTVVSLPSMILDCRAMLSSTWAGRRRFFKQRRKMPLPSEIVLLDH